MFKFVGGVVVGVFVGALALEILGRTQPDVLNKIQDMARKKAKDLTDLAYGDADDNEEPYY